MSSTVPIVPADRIDRYEILAELGRGAAGVVFKARDPELDRVVAIKTLRPTRESAAGQSGPVQRRFRSEAATVARLNHPKIVAIYDVVNWHDTPCIVMEYVEGRTLAQLIADGPMVPPEAIHIVLQMCEALEYAHALGVVHRDIKPGNILVAKTGVAKLGDFSIASLTGSGAEETEAMVGTPGYMAPEQVTGAVTDERSDIFALGVVLYEAVSGVRAFPGTDLIAVLHDTAHVEPASLRGHRPAVTPALAAVIRQAMNKRPDDRYESAQALARALARTRDLGGVARRAGTFRAMRRALTVGLAGLAIAGSTSGLSEARRSVVPAEGPGETNMVTEASDRLRPTGTNEVHRTVESRLGGPDASAAIPRPERTGHRTVASGALDGGERVGRAERAVTLERATEALGTIRPPQRHGCLSVNAVPFATVLVDGQLLGETPAACLRVEVGEHRVQLQQAGDRSPERVVRIDEQHTVKNPVRLSYDFRSRQFGD